MNKLLIEVSRNVQFAYPTKGEREHAYVIPKGVAILQNKIYSISGVNGSGKSTVLTLLAGLRKLDHGCIHYYFSSDVVIPVVVDNATWSKVIAPHFWKNIGFAFQKTELIRALSVKKNLELALGEQYEEMALTLFTLAEWNSVKNSQVWRLSGGQMQRLGIVRSFGQHQNLVFMDEPTNNLDKNNREKLVHFIEKYRKNKTLIMVSHDSDFLKMLDIEAFFEIREQPHPKQENCTLRVLRLTRCNTPVNKAVK